MVAHQRGFTVVETMISFGVLTIVLAAALGGEEAQRQAIAHGLDDLQAHLAASTRLEYLADERARLQLGEHDFDTGLPRLRGRETVSRRAARLYEVRVRVHTARGDKLAELVTLIAREEGP